MLKLNQLEFKFMKYSFASSCMIILMMATALSFSSCAGAKLAKLQSAHKSTLSNPTNKRLAGEKKLDLLAETLVKVLDESIAFNSVRCSVKHVDQFSDNNGQSVEALVKDVGQWIDGMSTPEKLLFAAQAAKKPYAGQLVRLIPKFEKKVNRKIRTFKILAKVAGVLNPLKLIK